MARQTSLTECVVCHKKPQLGVVVVLYTLGRKPTLNKSVPARGFCINCIRKWARRQGCSKKVDRILSFFFNNSRSRSQVRSS